LAGAVGWQQVRECLADRLGSRVSECLFGALIDSRNPARGVGHDHRLR
jgi:hypothetical protein